MGLRRNQENKEYDVDDDSPLGIEEAEEELQELGEVAPTSSELDQKVEVTKPKSKEPEFDPNQVPRTFPVRDVAERILDTRRMVSEICTQIRINDLPQDCLEDLHHELQPFFDDGYDEDFNIREELSMMLRMVKAARHDLMEGGRIKESSTISEVKSVMDASMKLVDMLNKANKDLINIERIQAIEACFIEVVQTMPPEQQLQYARELERKMKLREELKRR